jgi:hypothetical protein
VSRDIRICNNQDRSYLPDDIVICSDQGDRLSANIKICDDEPVEDDVCSGPGYIPMEMFCSTTYVTTGTTFSVTGGVGPVVWTAEGGTINSTTGVVTSVDSSPTSGPWVFKAIATDACGKSINSIDDPPADGSGQLPIGGSWVHQTGLDRGAEDLYSFQVGYDSRQTDAIKCNSYAYPSNPPPNPPYTDSPFSAIDTYLPYINDCPLDGRGPSPWPVGDPSCKTGINKISEGGGVRLLAQLTYMERDSVPPSSYIERTSHQYIINTDGYPGTPQSYYWMWWVWETTWYWR